MKLSQLFARPVHLIALIVFALSITGMTTMQRVDAQGATTPTTSTSTVTATITPQNLAPITYTATGATATDGTALLTFKFTNPNPPSTTTPTLLSLLTSAPNGITYTISLPAPPISTVMTCPAVTFQLIAPTATSPGIGAPATAQTGVSVSGSTATVTPVDPNTGAAKKLDGGGYYTFNAAEFPYLPPTGTPAVSSASSSSAASSH